MELINPNEIGARISTLIVEAKSTIVLISPYIRIAEWKKVKVNLERAVSRGVDITVYYREIKQKDADFFHQLNIPIIQVNGLHTKLYLNESEAIVTSMNLYESSDLHSIDLAIHYREAQDYNQLYTYFENYIKIEPQDALQIHCQTIGELFEYLNEQLPDSGFKNRGTYIFNNTIPKYDLLINLESVTIKLPTRSPSKKTVEAHSRELIRQLGILVELKEPMNGYRYCTWDVVLTDGPGNGNKVVEVFRKLD